MNMYANNLKKIKLNPTVCKKNASNPNKFYPRMQSQKTYVIPISKVDEQKDHINLCR